MVISRLGVDVCDGSRCTACDRVVSVAIPVATCRILVGLDVSSQYKVEPNPVAQDTEPSAC